MTLRSCELTAWLRVCIFEAWLENELGSPISIITNQFPLENFLPLPWYSCFLFEEKNCFSFFKVQMPLWPQFWGICTSAERSTRRDGSCWARKRKDERQGQQTPGPGPQERGSGAGLRRGVREGIQESLGTPGPVHGWFSGRTLACHAGGLGSIPGLGRSPGERERLPTPLFWPKNSMDRILLGVAKSQTRLSDFHSHSHRMAKPFASWNTYNSPFKTEESCLFF